ncbi:MAG: Rpn family recombination-promoting nuclease/putative transposase [Holosporaceae bacterium]|jgi:predicted transposase/invertase (TIGR01784 family)|nr:Rpn family recombination-promoting nuclease/putative transposase [Holosporaceae bacterium]
MNGIENRGILMTNLLDPKLDYIFKNIFGVENKKPLLLSFLNSLLKGNPLIRDLRLENTDITKILEEDKASRLDVKATSNDGTLLDIEIQCRNTGEIPQRAFHYLANMMPGTVKKGKSYDGPNVIGVWILGENVTDRQNAISEAYMTFQPSDPDPYQIMTHKARIFFVELQRFDPKKADRRDLLTAWLSFLKNPIFMDETFLEIEEIKEAMETLKYISADDDVRAIADLRQRTISDHNSELTIAREEGREEGIAIGEERGIAIGEERGIAIGEERGREEGELKGKREMALELLRASIDVNVIAKTSGLSIEEVKSLKS